ncbi:MAG: DUF6788 family protein [Acidimicrobiales bacterium]
MARGSKSAPEPQMLRGNLFVMRRRCGKPNCRCAAGEPHESPALAYPRAGHTGTMTLSAADVASVRAALGRYQRAKAALDAEAARGLAALGRRKAAASRAARS